MGKTLEKVVINELKNKLNINIKNVGFIILKEYGVVGASPDGITEDSVIEIKCPISEISFSRYVNSKNKIARKIFSSDKLTNAWKWHAKGNILRSTPRF